MRPAIRIRGVLLLALLILAVAWPVPGPTQRVVRRPAGISVAAAATARAHAAADGENARLVAELAEQVAQAPTDADRYRAVIAVMQALDIGVYTGAGQAVVRGAEQGADDLYLYDFEVKGIAAALGRAERWSVSDLARELSAMGLHPDGRALAPAKLSDLLHAAVTTSLGQPEAAGSFVSLLVRELGLRHTPPVDLASGGGTQALAEPRFDALQNALIILDITVAILRDARATPGSADLPTTTSEAKTLGARPQAVPAPPTSAARAASGPCDFEGNGRSEKWERLGERYSGLMHELHLLTIAFDTVLDYFQAILIGTTLDIHPASASVTNTHYGPEGNHSALLGRPNEPLVFGIQVWMPVELEDAVVACGKLLGRTFPKPGPVPEVPVSWTTIYEDAAGGGYEALKTHGTIIREDTKTNADGVALLVVVPNQEQAGIDRTRLDNIRRHDDMLIPQVDLLTPFGIALAAIPETFAPRMVPMPYSVEWHEPTRWRVEGTVTQVETYSGGGASARHTAQATFSAILNDLPDPASIGTLANTVNWVGTGTATVSWTTSHDDPGYHCYGTFSGTTSASATSREDANPLRITVMIGSTPGGYCWFSNAPVGDFHNAIMSDPGIAIPAQDGAHVRVEQTGPGALENVTQTWDITLHAVREDAGGH